MVKGLSHKVIIVKSPNPKIFEQAIFIVKDDYWTTEGISQKELMRQAKRAANGYVDQVYGRKSNGRFAAIAYCIFGALMLSAIQIVLHYLF